MPTEILVSVPGLRIVTDFISEDEEKRIIEEIEKFNDDKMIYIQRSGNYSIRVWEFGWNYDNNRWRIAHNKSELQTAQTFKLTEKDRLAPHPEWALLLFQKAKNFFSEESLCDEHNLRHLDHTMVNKYLPGQGLYAHVDHAGYFGPWVIGYVIGSGAILRYSDQNKKTVERYIPSRSCYLMTKDSRYIWTHEVPSTNFDVVDGKTIQRGTRYAVTLRSINQQILPN